MAAVVLRRLRFVLNTLTALCIVLMICFSFMHLLSVQKVYTSYKKDSDIIHNKKPAMEESYLNDLKQVNEDVIGWIELNGTAIDQPVVQGEDNYSYLHQNLYKEQSLTGSLFMDIRCDPQFSAGYHLIYGHHMVDHQMLADLDLYLDEEFFRQNNTGILFTDKACFSLKTAGILEVEQDDPWIYSPLKANADMVSFEDYICDHALYLNKENLNKRLIALSTCSRKLESQRIVLILAVLDQMSS